MLQVWDGETGRRQLEESRSFMEKLGMECEMLDPKDMAQRYPMLRFSDQQWGLFDPEAGLLSPNACITALVVSVHVQIYRPIHVQSNSATVYQMSASLQKMILKT